MSILERFSYSGLESYKKCPAQFKFRYIDKIRKPDEGIEAFTGKRVHEALEFLYNEVQSGRLPFIDSILDHYEDIWNFLGAEVFWFDLQFDHRFCCFLAILLIFKCDYLDNQKR